MEEEEKDRELQQYLIKKLNEEVRKDNPNISEIEFLYDLCPDISADARFKIFQELFNYGKLTKDEKIQMYLNQKLIEEIEKEHPHLSEIIALLEYGADVNTRGNKKYGKTALMRAARNNKKDVVELLIKNGADVNARDGGDCTPLTWAVQYCCDRGRLCPRGKKDGFDTVKLLIENGADVNARRHGSTALMDIAYWSIYSDDNDLLPRVIKLLIENGADVNAKSGGETAKKMACQFGGSLCRIYRALEDAEKQAEKQSKTKADDGKGGL